jgi:Tol biopolymer transport system component
MYKITIILLSILISISLCAEPFTALDMNKLTRLSQTVASPDGKWLVYALRNWNNETGVVSSHLEYINIVTKATGVLTEPALNCTDSNPAFASALNNTLFFLSNRSNSTQIWTLNLPETPSVNATNATQFTNYPIDIISFKLSPAGNTLVFAALVYSFCGDDLN